MSSYPIDNTQIIHTPNRLITRVLTLFYV